MQNISKVICVRNTHEQSGLVSTLIQVGKVYDMQRILYTDENAWDLWNCYIYDNDNIWTLPLEFFESLDEYRDKKINNILVN